MNVVEEKAYKCSNCGHTYLNYDLAEKCCKPKFCEDCGEKLPYKSYLRVCDKCQEKRNFNKAEHLTIKEYEDKYGSNMVCLDDHYYCSIEDCLCDMADSLSYQSFMEIKYLWGTNKFDIKLDFYHIYDYYIENACLDDFQMDESGYKELKQFIKQWNDKYIEYGYMISNVAIILPEEYMKEFWRDYHEYKDV